MDDKKKMIALGVLGAMFLAIGAFTFMPKGEDAPVVEKKEVPEFLLENEKAKATEPAPNPQVATNLAARDPFKAPNSMLVVQETQTPTQTKSTPQLKVPVKQMGPPLKLVGDVRAFDPVPGVGSGTSVEPVGTTQKVEEPTFAYTIGGVVVGQRSAVVFKDAQGGQRLVMQGGELDGDTKVIAVKLNAVDILFHGKKLHLPVGGESVAKQ